MIAKMYHFLLYLGYFGDDILNRELSSSQFFEAGSCWCAYGMIW